MKDIKTYFAFFPNYLSVMWTLEEKYNFLQIVFRHLLNFIQCSLNAQKVKPGRGEAKLWKQHWILVTFSCHFLGLLRCLKFAVLFIRKLFPLSLLWIFFFFFFCTRLPVKIIGGTKPKFESKTHGMHSQRI